MIVCKVCDVDNHEGSKFCIECGASFGENNGKESKRVVSAEEMKKLLWSIDWEKTSNQQRIVKQIQIEFKKWQLDPGYIPILTAPRRNDGGLNNENLRFYDENDMTYKMKPKQEKTDKTLDGMIDRMVGEDAPFTKRHYTVEERLKKNYYDATRDNIPCGVCGDMRCSIKHIPTIQQQYQEAFENIQRIRRNRFSRYLGGVKVAEELWVTDSMWDVERSSDTNFNRLIRMDDEPEELQFIKSRITGTDVRKGILPRRIQIDKHKRELARTKLRKPKPSERRGSPPSKSTVGIYK